MSRESLNSFVYFWTPASWTQVDYLLRFSIALDLTSCWCIFCLLHTFELDRSLQTFIIPDHPMLLDIKMIINCLLNTSHSYKAILLAVPNMKLQIFKKWRKMSGDLTCRSLLWSVLCFFYLTFKDFIRERETASRGRGSGRGEVDALLSTELHMRLDDPEITT